MSSNQHIVLLGGTGFVGSHLVDALHAAGASIDVLSRNRERLRHLSVFPRVRVLSTDVYDADALAARLANADVVINLVGVLQSDGFGATAFERAHVQLTEALIGAMKSAGRKRLLQMSSLRAGEGTSHYLRTRGLAEVRVKTSGLNWTLFQPSVIFGPGDGLYTRFAGLLKIAPLIPLARASAKFQPVYVKDVVAAMLQSLSDPATVGQVYPLVGPNTYTLKQIVQYTASVLGLSRIVLPLPDVLGRLQGAAFDVLPGAMKPFSGDNFKSLMLDSTSVRNGLIELGIQPTPPELIVPDYVGVSDHQRALDRYRGRQ